MGPKGRLITFGLGSCAITFLSLSISAKQKLWSATSNALQINYAYLVVLQPEQGVQWRGHGWHPTAWS